MARRYKDIANRLTAAREALGMSQAELCRALKVQTSRWNQYETGERRITVEVAGDLEKTFGITMSWVYIGNPAGLPHDLHRKILKIA